MVFHRCKTFIPTRNYVISAWNGIRNMYTGKNSRAKETNWNTLLRKLLELHVYLARLSAATVALDGRRALAFSHYSHAPSLHQTIIYYPIYPFTRLFYCYHLINIFLLIQQRIIAKHDIIPWIILNFDSIITEEWITRVDLVLKLYEDLIKWKMWTIDGEIVKIFFIMSNIIKKIIFPNNFIRLIDSKYCAF